MWTKAPIGRITTAATRSLEIAVDGVTPNSRISIGVISAPPPAPVIPTSSPMIAAPRTMYGSMCMRSAGGDAVDVEQLAGSLSGQQPFIAAADHQIAPGQVRQGAGHGGPAGGHQL